jgi:hypothetical protein
MKIRNISEDFLKISSRYNPYETKKVTFICEKIFKETKSSGQATILIQTSRSLQISCRRDKD